MKIALLNPLLPPLQCGVGHYTGGLAQALRGHGLAAQAVTSLPAQAAPGVVPLVPPRWTVAQLPRLLRWLAAAQPDIVHLQFPSAGYRHGVAALLPWAIRQQLPAANICLTLHELTRERWRIGLEGMVATLAADALLFVQRADMLHWRRRVGRVRRWDRVPTALTSVPSNIPNRPSQSRAAVRAALGLRDDDQLLIFFGFVRPDKGIEALLAAFAQLYPSNPRLHLAIYADFGDGQAASAATLSYRRSLAPQLAALQAQTPQLHLGSYLDDPAELSAVLGAADLGVLPFQDGLYPSSGVLMAMLAHDLPVVTTDSPAVAAALREAVFIAPSAAAAGIAGTIEAVLAQPAYRTQRRGAQRAWIAHHGWEEIVQQHQALYAALLAHPRGRHP